MTAPAAPILRAEKIEFAYGSAEPVLRGVDLAAPTGKLVCMLGPNGSGKTTLLRCLLGRFRPRAGQVVFDGRNVRDWSEAARARRMAYVPQVAVSAFAFTCRQIVLMGRFAHTGWMGLPTDQDLAVAEEALRMTQTQGFADRMLDELSGGEAQRVMIARALAQQPLAMLLDEPTSHLDIRNQLLIYRMMRRVAHEWPMAVVCVSHDVNLAARFADELVLLRDGRAVAVGPPRDVVREDVLEEVYDVEVDLIATDAHEVPLVRARWPEGREPLRG